MLGFNGKDYEDGIIDDEEGSDNEGEDYEEEIGPLGIAEATTVDHTQWMGPVKN